MHATAITGDVALPFGKLRYPKGNSVYKVLQAEITKRIPWRKLIRELYQSRDRVLR